jgi:hypothetical protein
MPLTIAFAVALTAIVDKDAECRRRINSGFAALGANAGAFRNAAYCLANLGDGKACAPTPKQMEKICYGIAEATINAINAVGSVPSKRAGTLATLRYASEIGRNVGEGGEHYATKVSYDEGGTFAHCVFDWWATLHTADPLIYLTTADFTAARNGVTLTRFVTPPP